MLLSRWFFQQLILALDYCHQKGVGHRDIKLENVLLQNHPRCPRPLVKICDFGYSKGDNRSLCVSKVGTLLYMAPEVIEPQQGQTYSARAADLWSCGVLLYTMLVGTYPFRLPTDQQSAPIAVQARALHKMMMRHSYIIPQQLNLSQGCTNLLAGLLNPLAHQRITMQGVLQDPWFREGLPPAALTMTNQWLAQGRVCRQSIQEMKQIVSEALVFQPDDLDLQDADQLGEDD
jgi:serine/threonine-protein kinase SRK2